MLAATSRALAKSVQPTHPSRRTPENPPVRLGIGAVPFTARGGGSCTEPGAERGTVAMGSDADILLPQELPGMSVKPRSATLPTGSLKTCLAIVQITLPTERREHLLCFQCLGN